MSLWTFFKLIAAACVLAVMAFTAMLTYHVTVEPLGGVFSEIIPAPVNPLAGPSDEEFAEMLDAAEMPDIDPGERAYQKAHEMLAMGKLAQAREKLTAIVNVFPGSSSAPVARRIVGEINLDEVLSTSHMEGKKSHVVRPGESFLGIVAKHDTTLDCLMHLNSMMELRNLHPGDELVVMPLDFRLLIEPRRNSISLWDGGRFLREYLILDPGGMIPNGPAATRISAKSAQLDGARVLPQSPSYRAAEKIIQIAKPALQIRAWDGVAEKTPGAILLQPQDLEELCLLTRVGNAVEIR